MATSKRAGKHSLQQNDNLFPAAPLIGTVTNVGTGRPYNNGAASVPFTAQGPNTATSYTVTSSPGGYQATGSSSPITVEGLQSATDYSFTVTATNSYGTSTASSASNTILATTVPATPAAPSASTPSAGVDRVSWTAPANGGAAITNYYWVASDGKTGNTAATSVDVGQEQGSAQTYTVRADNANGSSGTSAASNSVTTTFSFAPFGAFGFSPFGFSPFGFSPFGFSPFWCLGNKTKVATINDAGEIVLVEARKLVSGIKVYSPIWDELDSSQNPHIDRVEYNALTNKSMSTGVITRVIRKPVNQTIVFNNDKEKHYSLTQPILARKNKQKDAWEKTQDLAVGDIIWEYDFDTNSYVETPITAISILDGDTDVYMVSVDGPDTFVGGGIVCHNK